MDVLSKSQRSFNMSQIRGINTKPELIIKSFLRDLKIPFRIHVKSLAGKPDFYIPYNKLAIFVNGCFWHGHKSCKYFVLPKTNSEFWFKKIESNISRDRKALKELKKNGYNILVIWECEVKNGQYIPKILHKF